MKYIDFKDPAVVHENLIDSLDRLKYFGDFSQNQKCLNDEYKTKLLNIEQMWKKEKEPGLHHSSEFNIYRNKELDACKHSSIKLGGDDEEDGFNLFKFNDDLLCNNGLSHTYWKDIKKLIEDPEYQESTAVVLNHDMKEIDSVEVSNTKQSKHKILDLNSEHNKESSQNSNKKRIFKDLHLRLDVVNKTFVRSIKRYYDNLCCNKKRIKSAKNVSAVAEAWNWIDEIWKTKFKDYFNQDEILETLPTFELLTTKESNISQNDSSSKYSDVKLLVACMTMPDVLKVYMKTKSRKITFTTFSNAIYKYSHKNMLKLMENKTFNIILDQYNHKKLKLRLKFILNENRNQDF